MTTQPDDRLKGRWLSLFQRLKGMEESQVGRGVAVVSITLIFTGGALRHWSKPACKRMEPGGDTTLLDLLCQDDEGA